MRSFILGEAKAPPNLILKTKINPAVTELITRDNIKEARYELTISKKASRNAYIYIDFPSLVFDGGYYYSINLGPFCVY